MTQPYEFPTVEQVMPANVVNDQNPTPRDLEAVHGIPVMMSVVVGRATMPVSQLLKLGRGAVIELDRKLGEPVDILVNNRLIARGELVMVDEHNLGISMTEIAKSDRPL